MSVYFTDAELACKHCGMVKLHRGFRDELVSLRVAFKRPMVLNSACRCAVHNKAEGGHEKSLHVGDEPQQPGQQGCLAVDVRCPDGIYKGVLFALAWSRGWSIGWGKGFLHLDRRDYVGLPQRSFDY